MHQQHFAAVDLPPVVGERPVSVQHCTLDARTVCTYVYLGALTPRGGALLSRNQRGPARTESRGERNLAPDNWARLSMTAVACPEEKGRNVKNGGGP